MIVGTKIYLVLAPTTFVRTVIPTNVAGTIGHINSLNIGQFN